MSVGQVARPAYPAGDVPAIVDTNQERQGMTETMQVGESEYERAVAYCESLLRPLTEQVGEDELRLHFERMRYLLARLGDPQLRFRTVHVAGTSGKGSTTAMIGAILHAAGLRTAVHCTPYVQTPIERMQVGGLYASASDFVSLVDTLRPHIRHMQAHSLYRDISYREVAVAQAFLHFAANGVDIAAIETGMGGRYDYTNHVSPLATAIVTVDYDHLATLGPTLDRIAYHKAGIIKEGVPAVTGVRESAALAVIEAEAARRHAPLYRLGKELQIDVRQSDLGGPLIDYTSPWGAMRELRVGMLGRHQALNAAMAIGMAQLLRQQGLPVTEQAMRQGLARARLPGRLEVVDEHPTMVLDGAHNPEKMRALALALSELFPGQKPVLVIGVLAAKQVADILAEVVPAASTVVVTTLLVHEKPAVPPDVLAAVCRRMGRNVVVEPDLPGAIERARALAGAAGLVCVTGSLYMVGQARERWVPTSAVLTERTSFPVRRNASVPS